MTFLAESPPKSASPAAPRATGTDELSVAGSEIYLWCPDGYGKSKLNNSTLEKRLATRATTRNWRTVTRLAEMTS